MAVAFLSTIASGEGDSIKFILLAAVPKREATALPPDQKKCGGLSQWQQQSAQSKELSTLCYHQEAATLPPTQRNCGSGLSLSSKQWRGLC